jgi:hypothetical protein
MLARGNFGRTNPKTDWQGTLAEPTQKGPSVKPFGRTNPNTERQGSLAEPAQKRPSGKRLGRTKPKAERQRILAEQTQKTERRKRFWQNEPNSGHESPQGEPLTRKKPGRPATGQDPVSAIQLLPTLRSAIENWAHQQDDKPSRSEAIRQLIEIALSAKSKRQSGRGEK